MERLTPFSETSWPTDDEVAEALIGRCLGDKNAAEHASTLIKVEDLPPDGMTGQPLQAIWAGLLSVIGKGKTPAPFAVAEEMRQLGVVPKHEDGASLPMTARLGDIAARHSRPIDVEQYVKIIKRYATRRQLRLSGHQMVDLANRDGLETEEYLAQAEALLQPATAGASFEMPRLMGDILHQRMEFHRNRKVGEMTGLKTGFSQLDNIFQGMQDGDMIIIAARPSMGKTALAQNIADVTASKKRPDGAPRVVYYANLEMVGEALGDRTIAASGGMDAGLLRGALASKEILTKVHDNLTRQGLYTARYHVDDLSMNVSQIRAKALRIKRVHGMDLMLIDYLQLLQGVGKYAGSGNRVQEVTEISRSIKQLARELKIPIIALSQLSRKLEDRTDKRPMLSDLRESGAIEQDADVVAFIYRDDYYNPDSKDAGTAEVIVAKNRNGGLGKATLGFIKEFTRFVNIPARG